MPQAIFKPALMQYMTMPRPDPSAASDWLRDRWTTIKNQRPDLEPDKGFYDPGSQEVIDKQLMQMDSAGVDCVYVDAWWDPVAKRPTGDHALQLMLKSTVRHNLKLCISLDTENGEMRNNPITMGTWENICDWFGDLSDHPMYFKHNTQPFLKILKFADLAQKIAPRLSMNARAMMEMLRRRARLDAYIVAGVDADEFWTWQAFDAGCNGHSFYNMFNRTFTNPVGPAPSTFAELWANYMETFKWLVRRYSRPEFQGKMDLWPTFTYGWDAKLLVGGRLIGIATDAEKQAAGSEFQAFVASNPMVKGTVTNAFNEWYENGRACFEPTKADGRLNLNTWSKYVGNT